MQIAWCAVRAKKSYFCTYYHRLKTRLGPKKAIIAVARRIAVCIYLVLKRQEKYYDLGANFVDKKSIKNKLNYYKRKILELETTAVFAV